jgi:hypothetical protein
MSKSNKITATSQNPAASFALQTSHLNRQIAELLTAKNMSPIERRERTRVINAGLKEARNALTIAIAAHRDANNLPHYQDQFDAMDAIAAKKSKK